MSKEGRALPGTIYMEDDYLNMIITKVASAPKDQRSEFMVVVAKQDHYRCNSDEVVLSNHKHNKSLKADLLEVVQCQAKDVGEAVKKAIGLPNSYYGGCPNGKVTLFYCNRFRGKLIDEKIKDIELISRLNSGSRE